MSTVEVSFVIERSNKDVVYKVVARIAREGCLFGPPQILHDSHIYEAARAAHLRAIHAATRENWPALTVARAAS